MRFVTCRTQDGLRGARVDGDMLTILEHPDAAAAAAVRDRSMGAQQIPITEARLGLVSRSPRKIFCVGLNYESHIREMGCDLPEYPTLFAKFALSLIGPNDDIALPKCSDQVDWEAELCVVIGSRIRDASNRNVAGEAIAGFTVMNDISIRDWQSRTKQWLSGKTFESSTPVGPMIVTPDEVDWAADLEVRCAVNQAVMQSARTSDLVFDPIDLVAYISQIITLEPGDLIATGTPGGVGAGRNPKVFLKPGDTVRTYIEGIGELINECVGS